MIIANSLIVIDINNRINLRCVVLVTFISMLILNLTRYWVIGITWSTQAAKTGSYFVTIPYLALFHQGAQRRDELKSTTNHRSLNKPKYGAVWNP